MKIKHKPVLTSKILKIIADHFKNNTKKLKVVDCTLGDGGHSFAMYEKLQPSLLVSLDWDISSINFVSKYYKAFIKAVFRYDFIKHELVSLRGRLKKPASGWYVIHSNFANLREVVQSLDVPEVDVILWDLGLSTRQLEAKGRGFSFNDDSVLDLRISPHDNQVPAYKLLNVLSQKELTHLFNKNVGMPRRLAGILAKEIIAARRRKPFGDKQDMRRIKSIAYKLMPLRKRSIGHLHPATLILLALRIAVNYEFDNLVSSLENSLDILSSSGILLIITFHSGEETIVKNWIENKQLVSKIVEPSQKEISINPRSRSAKLFIATRNENNS